jgi:peroxiredoxin (alkyl hydroperoxide reductase subunit C)
MAVLTGKKAPHFSLKAVINGTDLDTVSLDHFKDRYLVLFFYPLDFTFVCPTELHAFQEQKAAFEARQTAIVGCSVDSVYSHLAWLNTPRNKGGIQGVTYPILSDINKELTKAYDLLTDDGIAYRGLFLIDRAGVVRHQVVNDLPLGRSVDEALRMVDALQFFEKEGEVCPANWKAGQKAMKPTAEGVASYLA